MAEYRVKYTSAFKKSIKLMKKRGFDTSLVLEVIDRLRRGEALDQRYRDHALSGIYEGFRECHIKPDWLLIYYVDAGTLTLVAVDTGTHSDLF